MNIINSKYLILIMLLFVTSCSPGLLFVTSAAAVGTTAQQERSFGNTIDDASIWARIKNAFFIEKNQNKLFERIGIKVIEGRVLLTGSVKTPKERLQAIKITWSQKGVREVINEIKIEDKLNKSHNYLLDFWITTQIKSKIIFNKNVNSVNYSIETIDQVVYVIGIARSENELSRVMKISGTTKNVKRVVSYVRINNSQIRKQMLKKRL